MYTSALVWCMSARGIPLGTQCSTLITVEMLLPPCVCACAAVEKHLDVLVARLTETDAALTRRLEYIEANLMIKVEELAHENDLVATGWVKPFIVLCAVLLMLGTWGCMQQRTILKLHKN